MFDMNFDNWRNSIEPDQFEPQNENPLPDQQATNMALSTLEKMPTVIPQYRDRAGQKQLIEAIAKSLNNKQILVAEAGTGTGKTFSYVLGALPQILQLEKRLIISTHTVSLQTQLIKKDLPVISQLLDEPLDIQIAKGGEHYFCPKRAAELLEKTDKSTQLSFDSTTHMKINPAHMTAVQNLYQDHDKKIFNGDLDELIDANVKSVIPLVQRRRDRCAGLQLCNHKEKCPYYIQKAKLARADIIVTNHALLSLVCLNNMSTFGKIEDALLVVDEAHHFADVYRNQSEMQIVLDTQALPNKNLEGLEKAVSKCVEKIDKRHLSDIDVNKIQQDTVNMLRLGETLSESLIELDQFLSLNFSVLRGPKRDNFDDDALWKLGFKLTPEPLMVLMNNIHSSCVALSSILTRLDKTFLQNLLRKTELIDKEKTPIGQVAMDMAKLMSEVSVIKHCVQNYIECNEIHAESERVAAGYIRWIHYTPDNKGNKVFAISSNRLDITQCVKSSIFDVFYSTVFTSATLQALGTFERFNHSLGLGELSNVTTINVSSPFDYTKVQVSAPITFGDPNAQMYSQKIAEQIQSASQRHQAMLVIFSSYRQMESVFQSCPQHLQNRMIVQKKQGRGELIAAHCANIDQGKQSILMGVDSLSEGIDLKGKYLTCVIVAKFPFPNMSDPILSYEKEQIDYNGGSSFNTLSLPLCSRKLIQSVGRLIRTEDDYGEVILLDCRIHTKLSYGPLLFNSLPFFQR